MTKYVNDIIQNSVKEYIREKCASTSTPNEITDCITTNIKSKCDKICSSMDITDFITSEISKRCNLKCNDDAMYSIFKDKCKEIAEGFQDHVLDIIHDSEDAIQNKANYIIAKTDAHAKQQNNNDNRQAPYYTSPNNEQHHECATDTPPRPPNDVPNTRFSNVHFENDQNHQNNSIPVQHGSQYYISPHHNINNTHNSACPTPQCNQTNQYHSPYPVERKPLTDQEYIYNSKRCYVNTSTF